MIDLAGLALRLSSNERSDIMRSPFESATSRQGADQAPHVVMPWLVRLRWVSVIALAAASWAAYTFWSYKEMMAELSACIVPGSGCNLLELAKKHKEEMRQWTLSLSEGSTKTALERVDRASSILSTYSDRSLHTTTGRVSSAVSCLSERQAQVAANLTSVDLRNPPAALPSSDGAASNGAAETADAAAAAADSSGGNELVWAALAGGATVAGLAAYKGSGEAGSQCDYPNVSFDACFSQGGGGGSAACQNALAAVDRYCACKGQRRGSGTTGFNQCVP